MSRFNIYSNITIVLVYFVILAGGVVRCTGSGMGCPDWPKCFGLWIPPISVEQLPNNFVELYSNHGLLDVEFNVVKTWTEYINRLLGVLIGISIFITLLFSIKFFKSRRDVFYLSLLAFVLVCFQGWLGAKVVSSNLKPISITIHMVVALLIVFVLIYANFCANKKFLFQIKYRFLILLSLIISFIQIVFGTQIRQEIDVLLKNDISRELLFNNLSFNFNIHVGVAYILLAINLFFIYINREIGLQKYFLFIPVLILVFEYLVGIILYNFAFPQIAQPIHLLLGSMFLGFQFYFYLSSKSLA